MRRKTFIQLTKVITIAVLFFAIFAPSVARALSAYSSLSDSEKALAIQYRYAMYQCLSKSDGKFKDTYETNSLPNLFEIGTINYSGNVVAGNNIAPGGGKNVSCDGVLEGYKNEIVSGGAYKYFGFSNMSTDKLWTEVLGYSKEAKPSEDDNVSYTFTAKVNVGEKSGVSVTNTVKINSDGQILNANDDLFALFLMSTGYDYMAIGELMDGDDSRIKSWFEDYLIGTGKIMTPSTDGCSWYARNGLGCKSVYDSDIGAWYPSITITNPQNVSVKKGSATTTYVYKKPSQPIAEVVDDYVVKEILGFSSGNTPVLSENSSDKVVAYKFWYDYLFGKDAGQCSANRVLKTDADSQGSTRYDPNSNQYLYELDLVDSSGQLAAYYAEWGGEFRNGSYMGATEGSKNIGYVDGSTDGKTASCKEIAETLEKIAGSLSSAQREEIGQDSGLSGDVSEALPPGAESESGANGTTPGENGDSTDPGSSDPTCFDGGGALGWILCPVIEGLGDAVEKVYEKVIEPFLRVDATLLSNSGSSGGTYGAWQTFQAIANIVFIILFLIVIFSQVTGVGIDNYGIKKILPKLIVAAILINLSYIICQLAVDISNVIGFSLKGLLDDMANGITINDVLGDPSANISMGATVLTVVVSVIAVGGAAGAILAGGMSFILPVLLALLSAFIAIMFVFILLGVRQAGVVLLVVISPLAFVCYMLPNTKKIFDRWLKIFQGLLLLYPICGLLMGGGNLASRILLSANSDSFLVALIAMLLNVIPFFFIPTLLRASFAAMGNIGAKITGVGRNINGTVNSRAKGSDYYKETQARRRAGLNSKGEVTRFGAFRAKYADSKLGNVLTLGGASRAKRSMARGRSEYLKNQSEHNRENLLMTDNYMKAAAARQAVDMEDEQIKTEEALIINSDDFNKDDKLREGLEAALLAGDSNKIRAYQNVLTRKGESGRQAVHQAMKNAEARGTVSDQARTAWASNIMNNYAKDYKANSRDTFSYAKDILRNGQTQSNGGVFTLSGNLASYEGRAEDAAKFTDEALAGMDDDAFARYNNNGNISQEAAYRALHNENARNLMQDQRVRALEAIAGNYQPADVASQSDQAELSLRLQHEQIAATQGAVGGQFQGRNIYRTPTGFNAVRRETNRNGDLIMVNDKGERWNSHKGIYER